MNELKNAADVLNRVAPPGERLAYVNPQEEKLLKAVGGSGKPAAGDVPSYKKGDVEAPPPRDYGRETRDTLEAQIELAPYLYAAEMSQQYGRPAYARAEQDMLWESLLGTRRPAVAPDVSPTGPALPPAREETTAEVVDRLFDRQEPAAAPAPVPYASGPWAPVRAVPAPPPPETGAEWRERMAPMLEGTLGAPEGTPAERRGGLLELYERHIAPSLIRQQRQAAQGEIAMLRELGPEFVAAQRAADPESEKIRVGLQRKAQEGLDAGQGLTEEEVRGITQGMRQAQSARGSTFQRSQPAAIQETLARMGAGRQAEAQRIARASSILGQTGQVDPFLALTGRTARIPGQVMSQMGGAGFALQAGPQLFSPESAYAAGLAGQNQGNIMNARMATQANKAAITGGLLQGLGSMGGGFFHGGYKKT